MKIKLGRKVEFELFQIEEAKGVERLAKETECEIYSWKTEGRANWFEKGFSVVDVLGLVVLAKDLPDVINLPNDPG